MEMKQHEEFARKIKEVFGNDYDWFISYVNCKTGDGMMLKKGNEEELSRLIYTAIIANYGKNGNENAAMRVYDIISNAIVNLLMNNDNLHKAFFETLRRAEAMREENIKMEENLN